jgi:phytoene dehydrogenase-like protein
MIQRLSRRRFLQAGALASAAFAAPRMARAQDADIFDDGNRDVPGGVEGDPDRVLVIGAGFAGLTAANALATGGIDVVVLEGRERLGGRTFTKNVGGVPIDMGASWIHNPIGNPMSQYAALASVGQRNAAITNDLATFTAYDATSGLLTGPEVFDAFLQTALFDGETSALLDALGAPPAAPAGRARRAGPAAPVARRHPGPRLPATGGPRAPGGADAAPADQFTTLPWRPGTQCRLARGRGAGGGRGRRVRGGGSRGR